MLVSPGAEKSCKKEWLPGPRPAPAELGGGLRNFKSRCLPCLFALSFSFFFSFLVHLHAPTSIGEFGWRSSPDRCDEAKQTTLVSFQEHHPSSWELSALCPLQGGGHRSLQRGETRTSDGSWWKGESSLSVVMRACSAAVSPGFYCRALVSQWRLTIQDLWGVTRRKSRTVEDRATSDRRESLFTNLRFKLNF